MPNHLPADYITPADFPWDPGGPSYAELRAIAREVAAILPDLIRDSEMARAEFACSEEDHAAWRDLIGIAERLRDRLRAAGIEAPGG